ncbi:sugar phosphate isomerase/epimerase family protein [Planctomycetota bacterium]
MKNLRDGFSRRAFLKATAVGAAFLTANGLLDYAQAQDKSYPIRLGGPVFEDYDTPEQWVSALKSLGYSAAYCPLEADADFDEIKAYEKAAKKADIIIAEVGAWSNPISPDPQVSKKAIEYCKKQLHLAQMIGANCCVNISGSRNKDEGPNPDNLSEDTFDLIVQVTRQIIDDVKPDRTYFTLETMPWIFPNSVDSYLRLIKAIDRKEFAAHFDPVNLINSPSRYFNNGSLIREGFAKLGPYIKSCHAKDTKIQYELTTHINEAQPGLGDLDYSAYLKALSKLPDIPLMLEHLEWPEQYDAAAEYIRSVGRENGLSFT